MAKFKVPERPHARCNVDEKRTITYIKNTPLDTRVIEKVHAYAANYGMDLGVFIDAALVYYMMEIDQRVIDPLPVQWCVTHHCAMQSNTSGTVQACPVEEGSPDDAFYDRPVPRQEYDWSCSFCGETWGGPPSPPVECKRCKSRETSYIVRLP